MSSGTWVRRYLLAAALLHPGAAWAQSALATVAVVARTSDGAPATEASIELVPSEGGDTASSQRPGPAIRLTGPAATAVVPAGRYLVRIGLAGHQTGERVVSARPGARVDVRVLLASLVGTATTTLLAATIDEAHQLEASSLALDGLPHAATVWSLLDTTHPYLINERIDAGATTGGVPVRVGGYGSSWAQTAVRVGSVDITSPASGGIPLVFPSLDGLDSVLVASAGRGVESAGVGPVVTFIPRSAGSQWTGAIGGTVVPRESHERSDAVASAIARAESRVDGGLSVGGPVGGRDSRLGLVATARLLRARWTERGQPPILTSDVRALSARATRGGAQGQATALLLVSDETRPYGGRVRLADRSTQEEARAVVAQAGWRDTTGWSLDGAHQRWSARPAHPANAAGGVVERLLDGPPRALLEIGPTEGQRTSLDASWTAAPRSMTRVQHELSAGTALARASAEWSPGADPPFMEVVDGRAARVWDVRRPAAASHATTTFGAFVSDRLSIGERLTMRAGARLDHDRGAALGSEDRIRWTSLLPRFTARWVPTGGRWSLTSGYGWYGHRLWLDTLTAGDPAAPAGTVYRWDDANADRRATVAELTAVAAVGGTTTGGARTRIDPRLRRPRTREFLIGVDHSIGEWRWSITGLDRRESHGLQVHETGVTAADYDVRFVADPGIDLASPLGPPILPISSRRPASFLRDASVLTNGGAPASRFQSAELLVERALGAWYVRFGGMTYRAEAPGANRGYRADENDQGSLGEVALDPNAAVSARGRLFFDRAYVIKVSSAYQAPRDVRFGLAARYQDGQPFSRVIVAEGLGQGTDIVATYPRGGQRFTYTLTLDARLQKTFRVGRRQLTAAVEAFNVLNSALEVEERVVTGPGFRTVTAVQPPRVITVGARWTF